MTALLIVGLIMMYSVGLLPSILIRFVFMKRAIFSRWRANCIVFLIFIYNVMVHTAVAGHAIRPGIHFCIILMLSYYILRKESVILLTDEVKPV